MTDEEIGARVQLGAHQHPLDVENADGVMEKWVVHRPTLAEEVKIGVLTQMLKTPPGGDGPVTLDGDRALLAFAIATLNVVVDLRPPGYPKDFGEFRDSDLISDLFSAYVGWRDAFRRRVSPAGGGDSGAAAAP